MTDRQLADLAASELRKTSVTWATYEHKRLAGVYPSGGADTHFGRTFAALIAVVGAKNVSCRNEAGEALKRATVSYPTWKQRRDAGRYRNPETTTAWGQAFTWIGQIQDPVAPVIDNSDAMSWFILGQDPKDAFEGPAYYKLAATADRSYRHFYDDIFFNRARDRSQIVVPWCDCRIGDGTPPEVAIEWMHELRSQGRKVPFWMGQAEWPEEFDAAMSASEKPRVIVGDINHMRPDQIARVRAREVLFVQEAYRNCSGIMDPGWPSWANANDGIGGNCLAVYEEGVCHRMTMADIVARGLFVARRDSAYAPQMTVEDFRSVP